VQAIVHAHPSVAVGMVSAGCIPRTPTSEYIMFVRNLVAVDFSAVGEDSVRKLVEAFSQTNIVLLKNHGAFSVGSCLYEAFSRIEVLEEGCKIALVGKIFGGIPELSDILVKETITNYSK
jgi:ribulose-5-phosphate 4-epimerase/fuculose-1-phosphate aldolase